MSLTSVRDWSILGVLVALLVILGLMAANLTNAQAPIVNVTPPEVEVTVEAPEVPSPSPPSIAEEPAEDADCPDSWALQEADNSGNRWFAHGIAAIRKAKSNHEARKAAARWLNRVKLDPQLLAGAAAYFLDRKVKPATLAEGKCASGQAVTLVIALEAAFAEARMRPEQAPTDGVNSGTGAGGNVVAAGFAGISGDRHAVLVTLANGQKVWIMARCGNPVVRRKPPVPDGPTDQPPPDQPERKKPPILGNDGEQPCPGHPACQPGNNPGDTPGAPKKEPPPPPGPPPAGSEEEEAINDHNPPPNPEPEVENDPPTQGTVPPPPP